MDFDLLEKACSERKLPAFRVRQIRHAQSKALVGSWGKVSTISKTAREDLAVDVPWSTVTIDHEEKSSDGSVKLRMMTGDGFPLEAVLMRFPSKTSSRGFRMTACLSSQSGCALACTFCATGTMGLGRNLTQFEIHDQALELARRAAAMDARLDNVVMMGMGEPLHNYDSVLEACRMMNDPDGLGLGARRIAISTAGWIPGIDKLTNEELQVKLALSLHAPNDELRETLMPVNKRYNIRQLMEACERYRAGTGRRIFIEYLMLDGVNDHDEHAAELAQLLSAGGFHVNLIAYNPTGSDYTAAPDAKVERFGQRLRARGIDTSYRVSRARDINGACGQLAAPIAKQAREARLAQRRAARAGQ